MLATLKDMPVLFAFVLGAVSQMSLPLSALSVYLVKFPTRLVGALAAFGAGALIAAVSRDLLPETHTLSLWQASLSAMVGAGVFIVCEHAVAKKFGEGGAAGALGIVVGAVVDGVPEAIIFGIQLASGTPVSIAFIAAVFVSNIPQAIAPSADLAATGWNWRRVAGLWAWVVLACGISAVVGLPGGHCHRSSQWRAHGRVRRGRHSRHAVQFADPVCARTLEGSGTLDRGRLLFVVRDDRVSDDDRGAPCHDRRLAGPEQATPARRNPRNPTRRIAAL